MKAPALAGQVVGENDLLDFVFLQININSSRMGWVLYFETMLTTSSSATT